MSERARLVLLLSLVALAVQTAAAAAGAVHFDEHHESVSAPGDASSAAAGPSGHGDAGCHTAAHLLGVAAAVAACGPTRAAAPEADCGFSIRTSPPAPPNPPPIG